MREEGKEDGENKGIGGWNEQVNGLDIIFSNIHHHIVEHKSTRTR